MRANVNIIVSIIRLRSEALKDKHSLTYNLTWTRKMRKANISSMNEHTHTKTHKLENALQLYHRNYITH